MRGPREAITNLSDYIRSCYWTGSFSQQEEEGKVNSINRERKNVNKCVNFGIACAVPIFSGDSRFLEQAQCYGKPHTFLFVESIKSIDK